MQGTSRRRWPAALSAAALLFAFSAAAAQDASPRPHPAADLNASLRTVINVGAELFNKQADYAGCYRVYQGALVAVKPCLPAELQARVDVTLARAEQLASDSDRAFELRGLIDEIRAFARQQPPPAPPVAESKVEKKVESKRTTEPTVTPAQAVEKKAPIEVPPPVVTAPEVKLPEKKAAETKLPEKKAVETKVPDKKPAEAKPTEKKPAETQAPERKAAEVKKAPETKAPEKARPEVKPPEAKPALKATPVSLPQKKVEPKVAPPAPGKVGGVVQFEGRPLPGGFFVTLTSKEGRKYSTLVQQAGAYAFKTPIPAGEYRFNLDPVPGDGAPQVLGVIPARYRSDGTSGLLFQVNQGGNRIELNLVK